jgi:hypothetical protein
MLNPVLDTMRGLCAARHLERVQDERGHLYWYQDDTSSRTTEDRRKMCEKWQGQDANTSISTAPTR